MEVCSRCQTDAYSPSASTDVDQSALVLAQDTETTPQRALITGHALGMTPSLGVSLFLAGSRSLPCQGSVPLWPGVGHSLARPGPLAPPLPLPLRLCRTNVPSAGIEPSGPRPCPTVPANPRPPRPLHGFPLVVEQCEWRRLRPVSPGSL